MLFILLFRAFCDFRAVFCTFTKTQRPHLRRAGSKFKIFLFFIPPPLPVSDADTCTELVEALFIIHCFLLTSNFYTYLPMAWRDTAMTNKFVMYYVKIFKISIIIIKKGVIHQHYKSNKYLLIFVRRPYTLFLNRNLRSA